MSDSDLSDEFDELNDLIEEYKVKAEAKEPEFKVTDLNKSNDDDVARRPKTKSRPLKRKPAVGDVPMDKVLFGDRDGFIRSLKKSAGEDNVKSEKLSDVESNDETKISNENEKRTTKKRKPVWHDSDDEELLVGDVKRETRYTGPLDHLRKDKTYKEYVKTRFTRITAQPKWANLDRPKQEENSDDELLRTVGFLTKRSESLLIPHNMRSKRVRDLNRDTYSEESIASIQFHPTSTAALVAGENGIATIYSIDGQKNEKLHSMQFERFPIKCAKMTPCGTKVIFGSTKHYYFIYDLISGQEKRRVLPRSVASIKNFQLSPCGRYMSIAGRFGELFLLNASSQELIHQFKQENTIADMKFTADSQRIICNSKSSNVSIFSLRSQRLEYSFIDEGCIMGRALDLSPNQRMLATGSNEGVVNVYDFEKVMQNNAPLPEKRFMNLRTAISAVKFNHSSELLAMSSKEVTSAMKLAHFPSGTVYSNFPGFKCEIGKIRTMEFSPNSGYLAMGNKAKEVPLFRLKHFKNY